MLKEKKRYLRVEIKSEKKLSKEEAKHCVYEAVFSFLGELGASKAMVQLKEFDEGRQLAVLKCRTGFLEETISALALKHSFQSQAISLQLKVISGNIGKLLG